MARASRIICASQAVRSILLAQEVEEERLDLVRHGVRSFFRRWLDPTVRDDGRTILFFGRMNKYKGLEVLLEAIPLVQRQVPEARFILAGEGEDLKARAEECKAMRNVEVIDARVPDRDVPNLFARSTVVVLPYLEASQSGITMIAFALGKTAVVSDIGGLVEDIEHEKTGLVVPPGDPEKLAAALVRIISDAELRRRLEEGVKELAEGPRSGRQAAENMLRAYQRALDDHRRGRRAR